MRSRNEQKVHQSVFDDELDDTGIPTARDAIARPNVVARVMAELALLRSVTDVVLVQRRRSQG